MLKEVAVQLLKALQLAISIRQAARYSFTRLGLRFHKKTGYIQSTCNRKSSNQWLL